MANLNLVTGYAGRAHITSADAGALNAGIVGTGEYVLGTGNQMSASIVTNNLVRVLDGDLLMQGRHIRIEPYTTVDMTIENGASGYNRNDLIVARYTKDAYTAVEEANLVVIKGTATTDTANDPAYTSGNILNGDATLNDMPLYRVRLEGLSIVAVETLFEIGGKHTHSYADLTDTPDLAPVATSGRYADLTGQPDLAPVAASGSYADLTNTPTPGLAFLFNQGSGYLEEADRPSCTASAWTNVASYEVEIPRTGKYLVIGAVGVTCTGTTTASGHMRVQINGVDPLYPNAQGWGIPNKTNIFTGAQIADVMTINAGTHTFTLGVFTTVKTVCYGYRLQIVEVTNL